MGHHYSNQERAQALARLEFNNGNAKRTANELGIPRTTLIDWRDQAIELGAVSEGAVTRHPTDWKALCEEAGTLYLDVARDSALLLQQQLQVYLALPDDEPLKPQGLREVAVVSGIASDKAQDLLLGRKGTEVNVDVRQQSVRLTGDELKAALAELRAQRGLDEAKR